MLTQAFTQKGIQVSCGRPLFEEIHEKMHLKFHEETCLQKALFSISGKKPGMNWPKKCAQEEGDVPKCRKLGLFFLGYAK